MAKTILFGEEYCDIGDIRCPKCGCEDYEWENVDSYPDGDTWRCTCDECGHQFTVYEESFYRIAEE